MAPGAGSLDPRVRRYALFTALWSFELWHPFWTLWLLMQLQGDFFQATLVDVVFWTVTLLVAMPAGAVSDRFGRKPSLVFGIAIWHAGVILFGISRSLPMFAIANAAWALGASFLFSSGPAFVYDTLAETGQEARYPHAMSRIALIGFLSTAAGSLIGGLVVLATQSFQVVLILSGVNGALATLTALTFREPSTRERSEVGMVAQIGTGLRATRRNPQILLLILFQILTGIVIYVLLFFRAPFIEALVGGDYALMGAVFGGFFCVSAVAALSVGRILDRLGETGALALTFLLVYPPFALVYVVSLGLLSPPLALAFAIAAQVPSYVIWGLETPVVTTIINRRVTGSERATVLSVSIFLTTLSLGIAEPLVGYLAETLGVALGLTVLASIAAIPSAFVLVAYGRSDRRAQLPTAAVLPDRGR
ncbi:MAG TPA: MFS transporter [Thermoplasmata archaeon]|nr:MFS transporter [Thermoplasmata archaeon]